MASLTPGVLIKLLKNINSNNKICSEHRSILMQVIGIIPAITGSELFPHQGFFVKVSDSSHSTYVSLSEEDNMLILENKLQIGQFIYVDRLRPGTPVPVLLGVKLVPGNRKKHPCVGSPKDLMQMLGPSDVLEGFRRCVKHNEVIQGKAKQKFVIKKEKVLVASKYMEGVSKSSSDKTNIIDSKIKCEVQACTTENKFSKTRVQSKNCQKLERSRSVKNAVVDNKAMHMKSNIKTKDASDICRGTLLPPTLASSGKRIELRKKEAMLMAAAAQREANAAAILVKGISLYADLLKSLSKTSLHDSVTKFFSLQNLKHQIDASLKETDRSPSLFYSGHNYQGLFDEIREVKRALQRESNSWFMKFLEGALDSGFVLDTNIGTTLTLLKQMGLWLDEVQNEEIKDEMLASVDLLKRKVYNCLLGYMESAALVVKENKKDKL